MRRGLLFAVVGAAVLALGVALVYAGDEPAEEMEMKMPFGGPEDVAFAEGLWAAMDGYQSWAISSSYYNGASPHGDFIRMYYGLVTVDGKPYHVVAKDNFGGEGATLETVAESPGDYLAAVTVMVQRECGYDAENNDWYWVKYEANGTVGKNNMDMALAGRVAKGMEMGCIACHRNAGAGDYLFIND
jgi:hypothetical protein